jgi:predicted transposase/invertase (TIGR01784 family)
MFFGDDKNVELLREFLIAMLDLPEEEYDSIEITDPHVRGEYPDEKFGVLDVQIRTKNGKKIDVEVQIADTPCIKERITGYTGKMLASQLHAGDSYEEIKKVISVVLLDYDLIKDSDSFRNKYMLYDIETKSLFTDVFEIHTFEIKKLPERPEPGEKNEKQFLWLSLIGADGEEEIEMLATKDPVMKKAVGVLRKLSADERTRLLYESREKARRDELARLHGAEAKGRIEGEAKGRTEGEAKGRAEVARALLAENVPIEVIQKTTGLSEDELENLR